MGIHSYQKVFKGIYSKVVISRKNEAQASYKEVKEK